ncbi:MAG: hypothetical protein CVU05_06135 [Bacteroidetes bacterium HGW-Bacteroidetes-21]|jgi:hypothetical protein|nr:MAG: hypothetical protein CVU05_06135 [Bacteroidetes bacterium HGW-Bacteroidetes-21]
MKTIILLLLVLALVSVLKAQNVAITDDNTYSPNSSAVLDVKSTNKGMLIPRVSLTGTASAAPVTSPATSLMVYNNATTSDVTPGYYYWNSTKWVRIAVGEGRLNLVPKSSNATLLKSETMIIASNDIELTLPEITTDDDGLAITIKNIGTYKDLIMVKGSGTVLIDGFDFTPLFCRQSKTFIAYNGEWLIKDYMKNCNGIFEVSVNGSWTNISEMIEFLQLHMSGPAVILLSKDTFEITETQVIDLPYPVTFEGPSYGHTSIVAGSGLENKPMFRCLSECYFKKIMFDATSLSLYGTRPGEDAIRLLGQDMYHEIKDCTFEGFYNTIVDSTNAELWLFECDITNANNNGLLVCGTTAGVKLRISETDFVDCNRGINLHEGSDALIQLSNGAFLNDHATDTALIYNPALFSFSTLLITNNMFNYIGESIVGLDFTRSDGRDANAYIENNAGYENQKPHSKINVLGNATTTTVTNSGTWVKANFTNTNNYVCKFAVSGNKLTYLSQQSYDAFMTISGNVLCSNDSKIFSVAIVKNGNTAVKYGQTSVKLVNSNNPYQWSTNVYLEDMSKDDYYEIWVTSSSNNDVFILQDIQWFTSTQ